MRSQVDSSMRIYIFSLNIEAPPFSRPLGLKSSMWGVMFIGYAIEMLRDEVLRNAASTPPVQAVLAAGYGEPHPFALHGEQ
jgi:hypothetical protein